MNKEEISREALRLECIKMASTITASAEVVDKADDFYEWIVKKDDDSTESK